MTSLTLAAEDKDDLEVIAARLQDAVTRLADLVYLPRSRRFAAVFNRYRWEAGDNTRVRSGLSFAGVLSCRTINLKAEAPEGVVSLLTIQFLPAGGEDPGGEVVLVFAGGGAMKLTVEALDASLADLGAPWAARARPAHED